MEFLGSLELTFEEGGKKVCLRSLPPTPPPHPIFEERAAFVVVINGCYNSLTSIVSPFQHP